MRQHRVTWLSKNPPKQRATDLLRYGYKVSFCETIDQILDIFENRRMAIIIISNEPSEVLEWISILTQHPETRSSRFILSIENEHHESLEMAANHNFRDMIPLTMIPDKWCKRFLFAVATNTAEPEVVAPILRVNQIARLSLPARVIWVSSNFICIESQIKPEIGSPIRIGGEIAKRFGLKVITGRVERLQQRRLYYRFSASLIIRWRCPSTTVARTTLHNLSLKDVGQRARVLLVMSSSHNRRALASRLDKKLFAIHSLLHMQRLVQEVHFLSPHAIFIDASLTSHPEFQKMLQFHDNDAPIYIIGKADIPVDEYSKTIQFLDHIPPDPGGLLRSHQGEETKIRYEATHLQPDDKTSFAEVLIQTQLLGIHPEEISFMLPYQINSYAIVKIYTTFLNTSFRNGHWVKITKILTTDTKDKDKKFPLKAKAILSDLSITEQVSLAQKLIEFYSSAIKQLQVDSIPTIQPVPEDESFTPKKLPLKKKVTKKTFGIPPFLRDISIFVLVSLIAYFIIKVSLPYLQESYEKSGAVYTDQIKKFQQRRFQELEQQEKEKNQGR